jgi:hypothetical protein
LRNNAVSAADASVSTIAAGRRSRAVSRDVPISTPSTPIVARQKLIVKTRL